MTSPAVEMRHPDVVRGIDGDSLRSAFARDRREGPIALPPRRRSSGFSIRAGDFAGVAQEERIEGEIARLDARSDPLPSPPQRAQRFAGLSIAVCTLDLFSTD